MDETKEELEAAIDPAPEETANEDERTLVEKFHVAKLEAEDLDKRAKAASKAADDIEARLMKLLEDDEKKSSARYQGLGHVTLVEGQVYASISKGCQEQVISYLKEQGREDMIKTVVHSATLTSYVNQCLKQNQDIPPGVTHYRPKWLNFYPAK